MRGRIMRRLKSISNIDTVKKGVGLEENGHHSNDFFDKVHGGNGVSESIEDVQGGFHLMRSEVVVLAHKNAEKENTFEYEKNNSCTVPLFDELQLSSESQSGSFLLDPLLEYGISALESLNMDIESNSDSLQLACCELTGTEDCGQNEEMIDYENLPLLVDFEEKCPPGGNESVVLYTTSLRGIRKTFEDCNSIRFLLESFRVQYYERDVSMHLEYREELWKILGGRVVPPRLFIRGRDMGGADEVVGLHEQGMLQKFLKGIPLKSSDSPCKSCVGVNFVLCFTCNGSCKIIPEEQAAEFPSRCKECNENGLIKCPVCS